MLVKILFSYFSLSNLVALSQKIKSLLTTSFPEHPMITSVLSGMEANLEEALQAIGSTTRQSLTQALSEADMKRDNSYRSLRDHVQAGLLRQNDAYQQACESLWAEFEKNDLQLYRFGNNAETSAIDSLLQDLASTDNQARLAAINATDWKEELARDNQAYVELSQQRSAIRSADDTVTDQEAFQKLKISLELLTNVLNALYAMNEPAGIQDAVEEVNQYIREATASAKLSKAHNSAV